MINSAYSNIMYVLYRNTGF